MFSRAYSFASSFEYLMTIHPLVDFVKILEKQLEWRQLGIAKNDTQSL